VVSRPEADQGANGRAGADAPAPDRDRPEGGSPEPSVSPPRTVLVVDDDSDIRELLQEVLRSEGYGVIAAENGRVALEHLRSGAPLPALVILDLMMPVMNGWELLDQLRADPELRALAVMVISGSGTPMPDGARRLLRKPFEMRRLLDLVTDEVFPREGT
jgi:CheY-like chemotaxis protein